MACPYFLPQERIANPPWPHPSRLPLGDAWTGHCTAPGHEGARPSDDELREGCNLGYARACPRLPRRRSSDAVRFSLARDRDRKLSVQFVCEIAHAPGEHGMLEFDAAAGRWSCSHADARIQKMAECYVNSYLHRSGVAAGLQSSDVSLQENRLTTEDWRPKTEKVD
ncbi:MAG: hypothetical protein ACHP7I_06125 [Terriglobales bacterium]